MHSTHWCSKQYPYDGSTFVQSPRLLQETFLGEGAQVAAPSAMKQQAMIDRPSARRAFAMRGSTARASTCK